MHLIETVPAPCIVCGAGNTPGPNGERRQFVDTEREVNWNEPVLICEACVLEMGGLIGVPSPDLIEAERVKVRKLEKKVHDQAVQIETTGKRLKKLGIRLDDKKPKKKAAA